MPIPIDYLFVDERRLNDYLDQLGEARQFKSIPEVKFELSVSPKVTLSDRPVPAGTHTKLKRLLHALDDETSDGWRWETFAFLHLRALRVRIPATSEFPALRLWLATDQHYNTYAIEDRRGGGDHGTFHALNPSDFSTFIQRVDLITECIERETGRQTSRRAAELLGGHGFDPKPFLNDLQASVDSPRDVTILGRRRSSWEFRGHRTQMFCYPIFIAEGFIPREAWTGSAGGR